MEAFRDYIDNQFGDHARIVLDGQSWALQFAYRPSMGSHWTLERIQDVLQNDGRLQSKQTLDQNRASSKEVVTYDLLPRQLEGFNNKLNRCRHPQSIQTWERLSFLKCTFDPLVIGSEVLSQLFMSRILPVRRIAKLHVTQGNIGTAMYRVRLHRYCSPLGSTDVVFKCFDSGTKKLFENEARIYAKIAQTASADSVTRYFGSFVMPTCGDWPHNTRDAERNVTSASRGTKTLGGQPCCETTGKTHVLVLEYAAGGTLIQFCQRNARLLTLPGWKHGLVFWHQMFNILLGLDVIHKLGMLVLRSNPWGTSC